MILACVLMFLGGSILFDELYSVSQLACWVLIGALLFIGGAWRLFFTLDKEGENK